MCETRVELVHFAKAFWRGITGPNRQVHGRERPETRNTAHIYPAAFVTANDPGMRFVLLCRMIATDCGNLAHAITSYSKTEYHEVADALTKPIFVHSPLTIAEEICKWTSQGDSLQSLMAEYQRFDFGPRNQPVRLLLAHFLSFYSDKLARPDVFCWPGAWMAGDRLSRDIPELFERHSALFVD